jgi:hypothetical protein
MTVLPVTVHSNGRVSYGMRPTQVSTHRVTFVFARSFVLDQLSSMPAWSRGFQ